MTTSRFRPLRHLIALPLLALPWLAACQDEADGTITTPSGRKVVLIDVITNVEGPNGATARFRFLDPDLTPDDADVAGDLQALCDSYALPRVQGTVPAPQQIVVSLSSAAVPFGEVAPDVVQFFEGFRPESDACQWEPF